MAEQDLDREVLAFVQSVREFTLPLITKQNVGEEELRAVVFQASHIAYQAQVLLNSANFIRQEAEAVLSVREQEREAERCRIEWEALQKDVGEISSFLQHQKDSKDIGHDPSVQETPGEEKGETPETRETEEEGSPRDEGCPRH